MAMSVVANIGNIRYKISLFRPTRRAEVTSNIASRVIVNNKNIGNFTAVKSYF